MKRFLKKVAFFSAFCMIFMVAIPVGIDPYNVFHVSNLRDNGIEPNKNYIKMHYILDNPTKYDTLLFGSSRVGSIHVENISGENCYNMTYSEGLPAEHLANIKTLISNNVIPKRIYLGVDNLSYTLDPKEHESQQSRCSYEYAKKNPFDFLMLYLDPSMAIRSLETTKAYTPQENFASNLYNYGWWCDYGRECLITPENNVPSCGKSYLLEETLSSISEIVTVCKDAGIELIVFTNPLYYVTYEGAVEQDYLKFLEELAYITDYYNFSGLNDITTDANNFVDTSHSNAETGDLILDVICNQRVDDALLEQGFGMYVTKDNVEQLLEILK